MGIKEKLFNLQQEFKSSKDMVNDFANFKYRNLENMMAHLKPILKKYNCIILFNDDIINVGISNYIKSTVSLIDVETNETISVGAVAKEDENRAGMMAGQMSGCSSSYSRKYALCGLLAVNEEKDLDSLDIKPKAPKQINNNTPVDENKNPKSTLEALTEFCSQKKNEEGIDVNELTKYFNYYSKMIENNSLRINPFNPSKQWDNWIKRKFS